MGMTLTLLLGAPISLFICTIIVLATVRTVRKDLGLGDENFVEFVILGDSSESYETFLALTYQLDKVRESIEEKEVDESQVDEILKEIDKRIMDLQETLVQIQTDGIPNPDMLTKRYLQELTLQALTLRIVYEKLFGRFLGDSSDREANIVKIVPINRENEDESE